MTIDRKDRLYLGGVLALLAKGFVFEPFEKARTSWVPSEAVLNTISILTVVGVIIVSILMCWQNRKL
jgi:hypothetical protein